MIRINYDVGGGGVDADMSHVTHSFQTTESAENRAKKLPFPEIAYEKVPNKS